MSALTSEKLYDKSAIAEQLAWRDKLIASLQKNNKVYEEAYVLVYPDGSIAGKNDGPGGYPFIAYNNLDNIHYWYNTEAMKDYNKMFPELTPKKFIWRIE